MFDDDDNKTFFVIAILIIIVVFIIGIVIIKKYNSNKKSHFISGGTVSQLYSKDIQDTYLNGNEINGYTNNDFNLQYDMPTRIFDVNRGYPTESSTFLHFNNYLGSEYIPPYN
jgi:uncharacterized membrane protein YkgB